MYLNINTSVHELEIKNKEGALLVIIFLLKIIIFCKMKFNLATLFLSSAKKQYLQ